MFIDLLLCVIGIAALVYSADKLVEAATNLALSSRVSKLTIGLTIIAVGTSLPELFVSVNSFIKGKAALSLGNVIGSNIMNIALILGVSAIILPIYSTKEIVKREVPFMIAVTSLLWVFARTDSKITPLEGFILIAVFIVYNLISYYRTKKETTLVEEYILEANKIVPLTQAEDIKQEPSEPQKTVESDGETDATQQSQEPETEENKKKKSTAFNIFCILGGIIGLSIGSELLVKSAINIATAFGISTEIIGLTLVAIGTSIPELATSVIASKKGETEISVGNILGSNIFNITVIIGVIAILPLIFKNFNINLTLNVSEEMLTLNIPILIVLSVVLLPIMLTDMMISRKEGLFFLVIYICYTIMLIQSSINKPEINSNPVTTIQEEETTITPSNASAPIQLPSN